MSTLTLLIEPLINYSNVNVKSYAGVKINAAYYERRGFRHSSGRLSDHGMRQSNFGGSRFSLSSHS